MRNFTWMLLASIVIFWIVVSKVWIGSEKPEDSYDFPASTITVTPEIPDPTAVPASPSASPTATPSSTPSPTTTPTISVNLQY